LVKIRIIRLGLAGEISPQISETAFSGRQSLYKALSESGNPEFSTVVKVLAAMGIETSAAPAEKGGTSRRSRRAA
jgi:DNA-binding phage protein